MLSNVNGFSGIHSPIYKELNNEFDISLVIDPFKVPIFRKINYLVKAFNYNKIEWLNRYRQSLHISKVTCSAFGERTRYCEREIAKFRGHYDFIFQISSMFMLTKPYIYKPYFIYIDRTPKMADMFYPKLLSHLSIEEKSMLNKFSELAFNNASLIFTFNEITKASLLKDYCIPSEKVFSVSSGVNVSDPQEIQGVKSKLVIAVCSDYYRHGGQLCIDAFNLASQELPNVKFLYIGENLSNKKVCFDTIRYLPYNELNKIYSTASVSLMLSPLGGFQTITDSMAHKCVCLALKDNPYAKDVIEHGKNGFMMSGKPEEISKKIIGIFNDKDDIVEKIGNESYKYIYLNCTWKKVVDKISKYIKNYLSY